MNFDELMMMRCLALAAKGTGSVAPNPLVGAVLVCDGKIIGEGYHRQYGGPHAEVNAIHSVSDSNKQLIGKSVLYVNLEPCNHHGKTPPCSDAIVSAGIKKVIIGTTDPNPFVSGGGINKLKANGVEVIAGILEQACRELNKFFFTVIEKQRPYILLKWAQSADGFIARKDGSPVHFTNDAADMLVHKWRAEYAAILIGGRTVISDNPKLTARKWPGKNPVRIIINTRESFDINTNVLKEDAETIIFNYNIQSDDQHLKYMMLDRAKNIPQQVVEHLFDLQATSVMIEGGAKTIQSFVDAGLWDEAKIFISPLQLQEGIKAPEIPGSIVSTETIINQVLITTIPV